MKKKAIFFDIDDTLYDSSLQSDLARRNALRAMIEAGLDIDEKVGLEALQSTVREFGSNYEYHFNELLKKFGYGSNPRIIAAGIVAYHTTKIAYLVPFPDTIPTLLKLRDLGYKLGVITDGRAVKQWEKLIRLGLQHFFDTVAISEEVKSQKPYTGIFRQALKKVGCSAGEALMVGDRLDKDISGAKKAGMTTVQILGGKHINLRPKNSYEEPDYIIKNLRDIFYVLGVKEKRKRFSIIASEVEHTYKKYHRQHSKD